MPLDLDPALSTPTPLLGGLSPQQFMRRHWQKKPLLVRQALPGIAPPLNRAALFELAEREDVESRLIRRQQGQWRLKQGPLPRRSLPPLRQKAWTMLVQGLDLHVEAARALMDRFRFIPDARLDDLMVSYASDGGGVGPHFDSYDVFLIQVHGRRRWRIGRLADPALVPGLPLKVLSNFVAEEEWLLEPGDMLYLPPRWAHDGVAEGECMTCSVGFRAAPRGEFAREVLQRCLDAAADEATLDAEEAGAGATGASRAGAAPAQALYRDAAQPATAHPAAVPAAMLDFAEAAVQALTQDRRALACSLGEWLSEPKPQVWFDEGQDLPAQCAVELDRRTRMLWDDWHVFINGESFRAAGRDAALMRQLADQRRLSARERARLSPAADALLADWAQAGWVRPAFAPVPEGPTQRGAT